MRFLVASAAGLILQRRWPASLIFEGDWRGHWGPARIRASDSLLAISRPMHLHGSVMTMLTGLLLPSMSLLHLDDCERDLP